MRAARPPRSPRRRSGRSASGRRPRNRRPPRRARRRRSRGRGASGRRRRRADRPHAGSGRCRRRARGPADDRPRVPDDRLVRRVARDEAALHAASIAAPWKRFARSRRGRREHAAAGVATAAAVVGRARRTRAPVRLGLGDEAPRRLRDPDRGRGGRGRSRRAGRPRGLDGAAPARACVRPLVGLAEADREARRAAHLLEHGLRRARRASRAPRGDAVPGRTCTRRCSSRSASTRRSTATRPAGSSERSATCSRSAAKTLAPTLIAPETLAEATTVQFPGLDGVLPGFGRQSPNDWGLGFELRNGKSPHWTGSRNSARTYGHFGSKPGTATFLWVDPERRLVARGASPTAPSASGPQRRGPPSRTRYSGRKSSSSAVELVRPLEAGQVAGAVDRLEPGVGELARQLAPRATMMLGPVGVADDEQRRHVDLAEAGLRRRLRPDRPHLTVDGELLVVGAQRSSPLSARAPRRERRPGEPHPRLLRGGGRRGRPARSRSSSSAKPACASPPTSGRGPEAGCRRARAA